MHLAFEDLEQAEGISGFMTVVTAAISRYHKSEFTTKRIPTLERPLDTGYMEYMVGEGKDRDGPYPHWIHKKALLWAFDQRDVAEDQHGSIGEDSVDDDVDGESGDVQDGSGA